MSFAEWSENKKKREQEKNIAPVAVGKNTSFEEWSQEKNSRRVDEAYLNTFISDVNKFFSTVENDYNNLGWKNASSVYGNKNYTFNDLNTRAESIRRWLVNNRNSIDKETYNSISDTLRSFQTNSSSVLDTFKGAKDYYSKWATEEDYNTAMESAKLYEELMGFDLSVGQSEIDELEAKYGNISSVIDELTSRRRILGEQYARQGYYGDRLKQALASDARLVELEGLLEEYGGYDALSTLETEIGEKKKYYNQARKFQENEKLRTDALNAEDFQEYVQKGIALADEWELDFGKYASGYKNDIVALRRESGIDSSTLNGTIQDNIDMLFAKKMTEEQVNIYSYYLAKYGKRKANEYLDSIAEGVNSGVGDDLYKNVEGKTFEEIMFATAAGLDQFASGVKNLDNLWSGKDAEATSAIQYAVGQVREDLADDGFKLPEWMGGASVGQVGFDLISTTTNMLPSILVSTIPVVGQYAGPALLGASATGNAYSEMMKLGYDAKQASNYAVLVGASEATLSYFLGGISKLGGGEKGIFQTVANKIAPNLDNAIGRIAVQWSANMLDEGLEEALQEVLDPIFKAAVTGEDFEGINLEEVIYSGLLGAMSAGVLEGKGVIAEDVSTTKAGKSIQKIDGGVERLQKLGQTFSAGTVAYKIADKVNAQTNAYTIGTLLNEVGASISEQNLTDIVNGLTAKGMSKGVATKLAKQYQAFLNNEMRMTDEQVKVLEGLSPLADVLRTNIIGSNTTVYQRTREYSDIMNLADEVSNGKSTKTAEDTSVETENSSLNIFEQNDVKNEMQRMVSDVATGARISSSERTLNKMVDTANSAVESRLGVEGRYESTNTGATRLASTKQKVNIVGVESIEDGIMKLKLDDGSIVNATDINFSTTDQAIVYEAVTNMGVSANTAWEIIKGYDPKSNQSGSMYAVGALEAYTYGHNGIKVDGMSKGGFSSLLSDTQKNTANRLGDIDARAKIDAQQKTIDKAVKSVRDEAKSKHKAIPKREGAIVFDGDRTRLTDHQSKQLDVLERVANGLGVKFHIFESKVDAEGKRYYTMPSGKITSANGWYDTKTGEIWIDLYAGNDGKGTMIFTAAHELTHFIRQWSPAKFKVFADFLFEQYGKKGQDVNDLIRAQIRKAANNGRSISWDEAYEEVVADSAETFLRDSKAAEKIAVLREKDIGLANKIKTFLGQLLTKMRNLMAELGLAPETPEGQMVATMTDSIQKLYDLWTDALADAGKAYSYLADINLNTESVAPMLSERTWTASEYVAEREKTAKAIAKALNVDIKTAYKYIDDINSVARLIADDRARLDYEPNLDDKATVVKPNSDYKWSVDMSTLCAKRLLFTGTFDAIQRALPNTVFDSEDIVALREMMQKRGYEVACGICYVESTRREIGRITQDFINSYIESQKTGKPMTRINSEGKVIELKKTKDQMDTTVDKSSDKFYAEKEYTPTLADLNTTDIDLVKRDHPLVYEAYLNFMNARGQAKPKLLETRAEYKGEILKHFKAKNTVKARNDAGGLRLQSFSDFEVPHLIDMMQIVMDMSRVGLKSQAYTKVPAFAEVFGDTGVKINLSLIAKGDGLDANGNLIFDDVEGINHKEAFKLRDKYSKNVGTILVGKTDAHIIAAMADSRIDYIIPFHKSSWKESLYDALGLTGYADYTDTQHEKPIDKGRKIKDYDPSEYWDFTKSGDENAQIYLEKCRKDGRIPKFPQFQGYPGYWKLLIDFKMYDNDGVGSPQEVVRPVFNTEASERILREYEGGHRSFPVAKDVVEDFVKEHKDKVKYSERTFSYDELVAKDDVKGNLITKKQQVETTPNGSIDLEKLIKLVRESCSSLTTNSAEPTYYIGVADIGRNVEITRDGIIHGIARKNKLNKHGNLPESVLINARATLDLANILANSIEVNRSSRGQNIDIPYTHVMLGVTAMEDQNGGIEYYAVRSMIQERVNQNPILVEANVLGKLYAVNAKKIDPSYAQDTIQNSGALATKRLFQYSVAHLLQDVKSQFDDTLSLDVYTELGATRNANDFSKDLLYSDRNVEPIETADYVKMYNHFGSTKNYDVAGYILGNGMMLDFSGKHWGDDYSTTRQVDHRDIQEVLGNRGSNNGVNAMIDMIGNGNIRLMPEIGGINLAVKPNASQMSQLRGYINHFRGEVQIDIDAMGGDTIHSFGYTRGTSSSKILDDIKKYFDEGIVPEQKATNETDIHQFLFSEREEAPPTKTEKAYKLMRLVDGKLYPLFIGNNEEISIGTWYNADSPNLSQLKNLAPGTHLVDMNTGEAMTWDEYAEKHVPIKKGKPARSKPNVEDIHWANDNGYRFMHIEEKAGGKSEGTMLKKYGDTRAYYNWGVNGSSKTESGEGSASLYALRPGWHFGEVPSMHQIGYDGEEGETVRLDNQVWVEVEMSADVDYNAEAEANWSGDIPTHIPTNGYYRYATNPTQKKTKGGNTENDATKADWYVAGAFKVNRILSDSEADSIVEKYNKEHGKNVPLDYRRNYGRVFDGQVLYSDRSPNSVSNRSLLANALESVAQNDIERKKLEEYKSKIALIESEQKKLADINAKLHDLRFSKGKRSFMDNQQIKELQAESTITANRINTYDRQLLNLESTKALKGVLEREKQMAYKRAEKKGREALAKQKERQAQTIRTLMDKNAESRKNAAERRTKTEVRNKIKKIVSELDTLLRKPTSKKHIKEELRKEVADALMAINMDTVGADERVAYYNNLIAKQNDPDVIEELKKSRDRIQLQGDNLKEKLNNLHMAYAKIKDSDDIELNLAYQDVIKNSIEAVSKKVGNTSIRDMTLEQLEMVYDLFKMIRTTIRDANKSFKAKKGETIMQIAEAVNDQVRTVGGEPYEHNFIKAWMMREGWHLLKPYVAFRTIGSVTFTNLYKELRNGEDTFYNDVKEAQAFIEEQYEKHGYKSWDMKETMPFTAKSGKTFDLTLEQRMTLYAYRKRIQAHKHVMEGGIVFEGSVITEKNKWGVPMKYEVTTKDAFNLSEETFADIANSLKEEQKAFVDEMQAYLSDTMGAKGNEVSMEFLGVKLFKEEFYLPIKSSEYYMNFKAEEAGEVKLKSPAFSKETEPTANNPIVLHNFTDLWAEHINDMSMYHSFVLALEDFTRVYNYKTKTGSEVETMDTKATLETAYPGATKYINKFLKDMNGGVRSETVGWAEKLTSLTKKGAVLGSASVAIQQPSAVMRAMAYINPTHFVLTTQKSINLAKHKQDMAELKKYAPIAGVKEMGRFDVGMGQETVDWIKSNKTVMNKVEDVLSVAPAFMDEVTWVTIWNAVKRETVHNRKDLRPNSEEFLKVAGERFTEVISLSQVYDSVFSRSDLMRNKSAIAKTLTAFMAEPTTTLNMLWDSWVQGKRSGSKKELFKTTSVTGGAVVASIVLNAALKSIVMAMRDDDEDESYIEKYLEHFFGDLKDSLNPLTLVPYVKDVWSVYKGYNTDRMDMALFVDLKKAVDAFDSDDKTAYDKWSGLIGAISAFFGVPVKNVERDIRAVVSTLFGETEDTTKAGITNAILEGWTGESKSNRQQLYDAMLNGDTEQIERIKGRFKDDDAISSAVRKALRENEPRIKEAAEASFEGDSAEYGRIFKEILDEGNFELADIKAAIEAEIRELEPDDDSTDDSNKVEGMFEMEHFYSAIVDGDRATANTAKRDIINTAVANGKSRDEAEKSFEDSFRNYLKKGYTNGEISRSKASSMLMEYGGKDSNETYWLLKEWDYKKANGEDAEYSKYNDFYEAVKTGRNLKAVINEYTSHGVETKTLASQITSYYKPLYISMTNYERANLKGYLLNAYVLLGYDRSKKSKDIDKWLEQ